MKTPDQTPPSLIEYLNLLRRRKLIIVVTAVLVASVAVALSLRQTKIYQASADVLLSRQSLASALTQTSDPILSTDPVRIAQTQVDIARLPAVAQQATKNVRDRTAGGLLANSTVTSTTNSDILTITVDDPIPSTAVKLTNAYARAFANYSLQLATTTLKTARLELQHRIAALQQQGDRTSVLYRTLQSTAQQLRTMELLQNPSTVVNRASEAVRVKPTPKRTALLGALFGLILGCALAFLWEALDTRIRSEAGIEERLGLPMLSRLPPPTRKLSAEHRLAMLDDPSDIQAEAIRRLRVNVEFANLDLAARTLMITSSVQQEGKSTTIANLAVALARSGRNVVLVDLDLRRPALATFFGIPGKAGVTDVALGRLPLEKAVVPIPLAGISSNGGRSDYGLRTTAALPGYVANGVGTLSVLPAGELPANAGEFTGTIALQRVIAVLRERYEFVLIDAPPMCVVGDAMTLSAHVDALIVVARLGLVDRRTLDDLARELHASPAAKLGFILTGAARDDYYGKSGYYGYKARKDESTRHDRERRPTASV
jgi:polysaccharide biosynthesis transport protein